jgi:ABC-type nitrate/sulfonate/bicarbonate transport system permease component
MKQAVRVATLFASRTQRVFASGPAMEQAVRVATSLFACLAIWEIVARAGFAPMSLFPPPTRVMTALMEMVQSGDLARDMKASLWRAIVGFALGSTAGVLVGLATGRVPGIDQYLSPVINILRPIPPVAAIPLVITWFGITELSKILSIAFAVFLIVWVSAHLGAREVPRAFLWSARTLKARGMRLLWRIILPAALPFIVAGFRSGIAMSFVMVYVSELAGASAGIGYQISVSHLAYRIDRMIASLFVLGACGAAADALLVLGLRAAFPWLRFTAER